MKIFSQCANCLFFNREKPSIFNEYNMSFVRIFIICFTHPNLKKKKIPYPSIADVLLEFPLKTYRFNFY